MTTCEMVIQADKDGKIYNSKDLYYQRDKGFTNDKGRQWNMGAFETFGEFVHVSEWEKVIPKKMTLAQVCEELGYEIELVKEI